MINPATNNGCIDVFINKMHLFQMQSFFIAFARHFHASSDTSIHKHQIKPDNKTTNGFRKLFTPTQSMSEKKSLPIFDTHVNIRPDVEGTIAIQFKRHLSEVLSLCHPVNKASIQTIRRCQGVNGLSRTFPRKSSIKCPCTCIAKKQEYDVRVVLE